MESIFSVLEAFRQGTQTVVSYTEQYLERIRQENGTMGAYLTVCAEEALRMAEKADALFAGKQAPALCGIPYSLKDNFMTKGIRTTCASRILQTFVPPYDATVVRDLTAAGAVLLGKTNMDEFAMGADCSHSALGRTVNPLDMRCSPGGSSGGAAASVAAHQALFAIGSDTGGSARQPAAFCGLTAMKPTYGRISRYGLAAFASSMDTVCPITHTVAENRYVLNCLSGRDARDMTNLGGEVCRRGERRELQGVRIGWWRTYSEYCEPSVVRCTNRTLQMAEELGAELVEIDFVQTLAAPEEMLTWYLFLAGAEASSELARYDGVCYGTCVEDAKTYTEMITRNRSDGLGEEVKRRILLGAMAMREGKLPVLRQKRAALCARTEALLQRVDCLLLPTAETVAFFQPSLQVCGNASEPAITNTGDRFTVLANLTGIPALQLPSGGDGVHPCGISLFGRKGQEAALYDIGEVLEKEIAPYLKREVGVYDGI